MTDAVGWISSLILFVTMTYQVLRQWRSGTSRGVSRWLFVGQLAASTGFLAYSWLIESWVFVVTNTLMIVSAIAGLAIVAYHRRREPSSPSPSCASDDEHDQREYPGCVTRATDAGVTDES